MCNSEYKNENINLQIMTHQQLHEKINREINWFSFNTIYFLVMLLIWLIICTYLIWTWIIDVYIIFSSYNYCGRYVTINETKIIENRTKYAKYRYYDSNIHLFMLFVCCIFEIIRLIKK